jgi:STE24 endopeptidase
MPLFNKFTPLAEDSPVYPKVQALAKKVGFPCDRIYVIDGSKRSSHSNAFVTGIPGLQKQSAFLHSSSLSTYPLG